MTALHRKDRDLYIKKSGRLYSDSQAGLFPCLWLGIHGDRLTEEHCKAEGHYLYVHQIDGTDCNHITLMGAFFPIGLCRDPQIRLALEVIILKFSGGPFRDSKPNLDELLSIRESLRSVGPIDCRDTFRLCGEGFLPFDWTDDAVQWVRSNFLYASEIEDYQGLIVLENKELAASTWRDLGTWLGGGRLVPSLGAILYENSD